MLVETMQTIFAVKAPLSGVFPNGETRAVVSGITRLLLILDAMFEDDNLRWFASTNVLAVFRGQILTSSYVAQEVIDEKIQCFTEIYGELVKYVSTIGLRAFLCEEVRQAAPLILGRAENGLIVPLSLCCEREKLLLGSAERDKLVSTFKSLHIHA